MCVCVFACLCLYMSLFLCLCLCLGVCVCVFLCVCDNHITNVLIICWVMCSQRRGDEDRVRDGPTSGR